MKIFSRFPVFRVVIPFSAGIICTIKTGLPFAGMACMAAAGFLLSVLFTVRNYASGKYAQRWLAGIPFYCCFFGMGGTITWLHQSLHHRSHFQAMECNGSYLVEIANEPAKTSTGWRFIADVNAANSSCTWNEARGKILVQLQDSMHHFKGTAGNKMLIHGEMKRIAGPGNPAAFDARHFYEGKGAWHQVFVAEKSFEVINTLVIKTPFTYARMLRDAMLEKLQRYLGKDDLGVAGALLLGYEEWLDPELESYWSGAGVLHVLCVSGMHVMLIYVILAWLLGWMERKEALRHFRYPILLMLIWFYAMVTGFSPSVIRAAAMISFVIAGNWINREASIYNLLCSSCILMFIIDPYLIMSAGFQLSFLAVCGIIFLHKMILPIWVAPNKWLHKIWELVSISIAAQLTTFPLSLFLFHQFPNYFLIGNLLIIPLSTIVMYSGLLLLVTDWIPYAGLVTGTITSMGIRALNWLVITIGELPGAMTKNVYVSLYETFILYLLLLFIPVWIVYKSRTWLFICLILISAFLFLRIELLQQASKNVSLTVYKSKGHTIISLLSGRHVTLISDSSAMPSTFKFSCDEHLVSNLVSETDSIKIGAGNVIEIKGVPTSKIYIIRDWFKRQKFIQADGNIAMHTILIIGGNCRVEAQRINETFHPQMVVFDGSCKSYREQQLKTALNDLKIKTWSVREKGAFQFP